MPLQSKPTDTRSVTDRLRATTEELKILQALIMNGDFSPRILSEFRTAVDSVRQTARVVQMWVGLQQQHRDPYTVMNTLSADRVRRATQIARDLNVDLQSMEVDFSTDGLRDLFDAITALHDRLALLFRVADRSL
jgi:glyoxylate carboligase